MGATSTRRSRRSLITRSLKLPASIVIMALPKDAGYLKFETILAPWSEKRNARSWQSCCSNFLSLPLGFGALVGRLHKKGLNSRQIRTAFSQKGLGPGFLMESEGNIPLVSRRAAKSYCMAVPRAPLTAASSRSGVREPQRIASQVFVPFVPIGRSGRPTRFRHISLT
jgi:hypothetical protein